MINRRTALLAGAAGALAFIGLDQLLNRRPPAPEGMVDGIVWQIHAGSLDPYGEWERLGAQALLLQWIVLNGIAFVPGLGIETIADPPNWARISKEPWARSIIVGLASLSSEPDARRNVAALVDLSARIARKPLPFRPSGYYFPVEADPTWADAPKMGALLSALPRPLWVSAYDNSNIGAAPFADWVDSWLPKDVGLFFQDGVGLYMRTPESARHYGDVLIAKLGRERFRMILEAFRPAGNDQLRPATAAEIRPQIAAYRGLDTFVFEAPHYLDRKLVNELTRT
ncbi:alpha-amylase family protein [Xanthobacter agilis]|jgi:hypothetical protein|uniref:Uncharacterized protein n=1 Tax=Xanthobacter agilis TaxID=47492 RepID=A0ABU0LJA0_XANAG|nr:hypothetical protein [Xanthobacter agilis]MDQ0507204.1 hypothetical protein [Xanthobacter agilis]